jgi:hypothetical protein
LFCSHSYLSFCSLISFVFAGGLQLQ